MLIREAQMRAFRQAALIEPIERMSPRLRSVFFEETKAYTEADLKALCRHGIARAEQHGIRTEDNVYTYIAAMVLYGASFDTDIRLPWGQQVLAPHLEESEKAGLIELRIATDFRKLV